jgi:hypothetical protein
VRRLPAKFYIILWTSMWAAAVGMFVMAFMDVDGIVGGRRRHVCYGLHGGPRDGGLLHVKNTGR